MSVRVAKQPRVRLNPDKRREQILHAALDAFHTKGYGETSMRDLADAVNVNIASIYHYFGSKDDLLFAILETAVDRLLMELQAARDSAETPEERLRAMLAATIRVVVGQRAEIRILIDNADRLPPDHRQIIRAKQRESALLARAELERLQAAGRLKDLDLNVATFTLNGIANWIYYWYHPDGPVNIETLTDQLAEIFFHGILKR
jgi:AcrR family transcriptional regulator